METEATESTGVVLRALATNVGIAALNGTVGYFGRNQALIAEAIHSLIDSVTEVLLLAGVWHGHRWDNARYFWGLLASISMFAVGGLWAIWEGIEAIADPSQGGWPIWASLLVLSVTSAIEATSWVRAVRTMAAERADRSWLVTLKTTRNTEVKAIIVEDSADLAGRLLAAIGTVLALVTGTTVWYGWASVLIGILLVAMAIDLGQQNARLFVENKKVVLVS
jgi:divalent metal cation (Fe/Co/Zn/Cd) transporter